MKYRQVDPYYAHGYSILGTMLRGQKDKTEAIQAYQMSITLVPGYSFSYASETFYMLKCVTFWQIWRALFESCR